MALLNIEKRTRALATDSWGAWTSTTDAPPYTNTPLVEYRAVDDNTLSIEHLTDGSIEETTVDGNTVYRWVGTGILDEIIMAVNGNIKVEYDSGRITGPDYAATYLGSMQAAISASVQLLLQKPITEQQTGLLQKQQALVERQTKGFDDDAKQKLLKQIVDGWSVAYSVSQDANSIPDTIKVNVIDSVMKNAYSNLGITVTNDPIGE